MERRVIKKLNLSKKKLIILIICLLVGVIVITKLISFGKDAMKPPVVFLIPENFIGPVFVVFDQKDGQDLKTDPLGVSVTVPENGLIKVKASKNEVLTQGMNYDKRNVYWIIITQDGHRINMPYQGGGARDYDKEVFWTWYIDKDNQAKQMAFDPNLYPKTNDSEMYHLTKEQAQLKTAYAWNTCDVDIWANSAELEESKKNWYFGRDRVEPSEVFSCMNFTVLYPKLESEKLSYENFSGDYSLPEFEQKLNEEQPFRLEYVKEYLEQNKKD